MSRVMLMATRYQKEPRDEVIHQMRYIKEELARSLDFDVDRIVEEARRRQYESDRRVVPVPERDNA